MSEKRPFQYSSTFYRRKKQYLMSTSNNSANHCSSSNSESINNITENVDNSIDNNIPCTSFGIPNSAPILNADPYTNDDDIFEIDSDKWEKEFILKSRIKKFIINNKVSHAGTNELLNILIEYGIQDLPKDSRTFLDTAKTVQTVSIGENGEYWHNGLASCIQSQLGNISSNNQLESIKCIELKFNIDGLPLFRGSKFQFWPILCLVDNVADISPFPVGIFFGDSKPSNLDQYFGQFITELNVVLVEGITVKNKHFDVRIKCFICDSPARAFIKGNFYK